HDQLSRELIPILRPTWRYNVDSGTWYHYESGRWIQSTGLQAVIQDHCSRLAATLLATVNGSGGSQRAWSFGQVSTWLGVMRALAGRPEISVREDEFDADPNLLNTPIGVVDLRTSALMRHDPEYLMRHMTAVAPDYNLMNARAIGGEPWQPHMPL